VLNAAQFGYYARIRTGGHSRRFQTDETVAGNPDQQDGGKPDLGPDFEVGEKSQHEDSTFSWDRRRGQPHAAEQPFVVR
jgi:hypothetical protein